MIEISHEIKITAAPDRVYAALTKVNELKAWHSAHVSGQGEVGGALHIESSGKPGFQWKVTELSPPKRVGWLGAAGGRANAVLKLPRHYRRFQHMSDSTWEAAMTQLATAQSDFMNGDATGLQQVYSHRDDVTVMGGFGGFERGWAEVGPRLAWAASHFHGGDYSQQDISVTVGTDVACLVCLERWARNAPDGQPAPVMELRVTQTFRLEGDRWRLVHRHADELVQKREPT